MIKYRSRLKDAEGKSLTISTKFVKLKIISPLKLATEAP